MLHVDRYVPALQHGSGWPYGPPKAIMLHSTRSGVGGRDTKDGHDLEMTSTINWFKSASSSASSNLVISPKETVRMVKDTDYAWHAKEHSYHALSIEITQPLLTSKFYPEQYYKVADACIHWSEMFDIPLIEIKGEYKNGMAGITEHERSTQGLRDGKSDLGDKWNWKFFMEIIKDKTTPPANKFIVWDGRFLWGENNERYWYYPYIDQAKGMEDRGWVRVNRQPQGERLDW